MAEHDTDGNVTIAKAGYGFHYQIKGERTNPLIVFVHPAFSDHTCFAGQLDALARRYRVAAIDMPGHGRSQAGRSGVTIDATADLIAELIEREGGRPAHLVGVSLGSLLAQDTAVRFPGAVRSLTVVGGYSVFGPNRAIQRAQSGEMLKWLALLAVSMPRFRRYVAARSANSPAAREQFYRGAQRFTRRSLRVLAGMRKVMRPAGAHRHPLLIVTGDGELAVLRANALDWQRREPAAALLTIEAAGHCANMDNPAAFNAALADFIDGVEAGAPLRERAGAA